MNKRGLITADHLTRPQLIFIRFLVFYMTYEKVISLAALEASAAILALATIWPQLLFPLAWAPAGVCLVIGLAGPVEPIRRALFRVLAWLVNRKILSHFWRI